ncbi:RepB family plasmid replication initiator protein [Candidatus Parcubacteria bacterium]|nr:MAG: RepB family plasmid replication initiator protein [Candidatus Parcubacteria bacterium]
MTIEACPDLFEGLFEDDAMAIMRYKQELAELKRCVVTKSSSTGAKQLSIPHTLARSAVFAGVELRAKHDAMVTRRMRDVPGAGSFSIRYRGPILSQDHFDVLMVLYLLLKEKGADENGFLETSFYQISKYAGLTKGGQTNRLLERILEDLNSGIFVISFHVGEEGDRLEYKGPLLYEQGLELTENGKSGRLRIRLNPRLNKAMFNAGWSWNDVDIRRALGRNSLAKWLYTFISSSDTLVEMKVRKLVALSGNEHLEYKAFRRKLRKAVERLNEVIGWELQVDKEFLRGSPLITVEEYINMRSAQQHQGGDFASA